MKPTVQWHLLEPVKYGTTLIFFGYEYGERGVYMQAKWLLWLFVLFLFFAIPVPQIAAGEMLDELKKAEQDVCEGIHPAEEKKMMQIADRMEENDEEGLKQHVNNHVLSSKEELEAEMGLMTFIPCLDVQQRAIELKGKMVGYEQFLQYSKQFIESEKELEVKQLVMEEFRNETPMFHLGVTLNKNRFVTIDSFYGLTASSYYREYEWRETERMLDTFPLILSLIQVDIIEPLMNLIGSPIEKTADLTANYMEEQKENILQEDLQETKSVSDKLKTNFVVLEGERGLFEDPYYHQYLYPSDSTYMVLERWEEVHQINSELPYPSKAMDEMDWKGIEAAVINIEDDISDDLYHYIFYDTLPEGEPVTVKELARDGLMIE